MRRKTVQATIRTDENRVRNYFEEFCQRHNFALLPVAVTTTKTPDYMLSIDGQLIVAKVKEILPTAEKIDHAATPVVLTPVRTTPDTS